MSNVQSTRLRLRLSEVILGSGARIERHELVTIFRRFEPVSGRYEPPLRFEIQAIVSPHALHSPDGVYRISHRGSGRNNRGDLVDDLLLDARIVHDEPEEPAERDGGGVAAGEYEVESDAFEDVVRVEFPVDVSLLHESREEIVGRRLFTRLQCFRHVVFNNLEATLKPFLSSNAEKLLQPPEKIGVQQPLHRGLRGRIESDRKRIFRHFRGKSLGIFPESEPTDIIESQTEQQILQVNGRVVPGRLVQNNPQPGPDRPVHPPVHGLSERPRRELQRRRFPLNQPRVAVAVENPLPQQIMKRALPRRPFRVIIEPSSENMLDVLRVTRHSIKPLPPCNKRQTNSRRLISGGAASGTEVSGDPIVYPSPVHE
nr:hypothetical protein Iba_chr12fCG18150 [Ipomoea batatas]